MDFCVHEGIPVDCNTINNLFGDVPNYSFGDVPNIQFSDVTNYSIGVVPDYSFGNVPNNFFDDAPFFLGDAANAAKRKLSCQSLPPPLFC